MCTGEVKEGNLTQALELYKNAEKIHPSDKLRHKIEKLRVSHLAILIYILLVSTARCKPYQNLF